jgi:hypothetical protein
LILLDDEASLLSHSTVGSSGCSVFNTQLTIDFHYEYVVAIYKIIGLNED